MKITPISGDMAVKLAIGAAVLIVGYVLVKKLTGTASSIASAAGDAVNAVNPLNNNNVIYQTANKAVEALPGATSSDTLGTWIYNVTHPGE